MEKSKYTKLDSIAVLIIALAAVVVAIWQADLTRKHNRLTVKPYLDTDINVKHGAMLTIKNKGEGAALINFFGLEWDGRKFENWTDLFQAVEEKFEVEEKLEVVGLSRTFREGDVIGAHEELELCELPFGSPQRVQITIIIEYESIYGEPFTFKNKFSWGG